MTSQSQRGGAGALQVQAQRDVILGVSEERVREIVKETASDVAASFADEGLLLIQERITKLDDRVIASLVRAGKLEVFADPGFQRAYKRAQEGAAVSEDDRDYDLLAGLISDRVQRGSDRRVRAGIERSIEIVDQIDEDSLRGLTVFQAIQQYRPLGPRLSDGLDTMDKLMADLVDGALPEGSGWLEHLDVLGALRLGETSTLKPFREYYPSKMVGYLAAGSNDPAILDAEVAQGFQLRQFLIEHELKPAHWRLSAAAEDSMAIVFPEIPVPLRDAALAKGKESLGFGEIEESLVDLFLLELRKRPTLKALEDWWAQIPTYGQINSVGRVLARANAQRLDVRGVLPAID